MNHHLILGGSGFIGSHITKKLIDLKKKIIILDLKEPNYQIFNLNQDFIIYIPGTFNDTDLLTKIFEQYSIECVYHTVSTILPNSKSNNMEQVINENLISTINLLNIMQVSNVNKIVFISSGGSIYGANGQAVNSETHDCNPLNVYGWMKLSIEKYIKLFHHHSGINYLLIRPSNVYGIGQNPESNLGLIAVNVNKAMKNQNFEVWGDGEIIRDYIHVQDLVEAIVTLIQFDKWNETLNVGSGKGFSINQVLSNIIEITGSKSKINYTKGRKVDVAKNILNIQKIQELISWSSQVELKSGILEYYQWLLLSNEKGVQ